MYTIEQNIKGTIYVYNVESYWDKNKKQPRQKRICIGKRDKKTGEIVPSKKQKTVHSCRDYGNYYLLQKISDTIGLTTILEKTFPDLYNEILTCVFYEISERKPLYLCEQWSETTKTPADTKITSPRISELLKNIGNRFSDRMNFFNEWAKHRSENEYLAFDITSISSYSKLIKYLEYGYNRDNEDLPQINMAMLFGETSLLPIFYNINQGSIKDVSTLKNMIKFSEHINIQKIRYVMDKGFYSESNIKEMLSNRVKFAISVPFSINWAKKLVDGFRENISTPANSFSINGDIIYSVKTTIDNYGKNLNAVVYFNERRWLDAKESLLKHIMRLELELSKLKNLPKNYSHTYLKYLKIKKGKNKLIIERNENKIAEKLLYSGFLVIISNDIKDSEKLFQLYRSKDVVERSFDNLKNELDLKRLRIHSEISMNGRLFVSFLSLILHSFIDKRMKDTNLYKKWTQEELMWELKRLKIVELSDNSTLLTEFSKNQKYIFEIFKFDLPLHS